MHFYFWHDLRGAEECGDLPAANNKIEKKKHYEELVCG